MKIVERDVVLFDVDSTLVKWVEIGDEQDNDYILDFYGMGKRVREITIHTEFLKSLKTRGYYIRVHSGNGYAWASEVVKMLKLTSYVDSVETKPCKIIDDKPNSDWMPNPIYLGDK